MNAFCDLCYKDPDTGELFCVRLGKWVKSCPDFSDGCPWEAERKARQDAGEIEFD